MRSLKGPLKRFQLALAIIAIVFMACQFIAPLTLPTGSVTDLSGSVGSIDNMDQIEDMNPFAYAIYLFGDANCHQIDERSYFLNGNEMPICARDLGISIGLVLGIVVLLITDLRPKFLWVVLFLVPMAIDGGLQAITDYESNNPLRTATGLLAGIAVAMFLTYLANELYAANDGTERSKS